MIDVVIVGSGPAGLSAAVYTGRAGLSTSIIAGDTPGGLLTTTEQIDNYLGMFGVSGVDMAETFMEHAKTFGAEIFTENVSTISRSGKIFETMLTDGRKIESKAVIFAAGSTPRHLGIEGENLSGVSYCATCDGLFYEDEDVVVVGGGDAAVEDALYLSNICHHVYVLVRRNVWRASPTSVELLKKAENVTVRMEENIQKIEGEDGLVTHVTTNSGHTIKVSGVFIACGQTPNSSLAESYSLLFANGFIKDSKTEGFFVAGDIHDPNHRQVVIAAGDGARAGIDATHFLLENTH